MGNAIVVRSLVVGSADQQIPAVHNLDNLGGARWELAPSARFVLSVADGALLALVENTLCVTGGRVAVSTAHDMLRRQ